MSDTGAGVRVDKKLLKLFREKPPQGDPYLGEVDEEEEREVAELERQIQFLLVQGYIRQVALGVYEVTEKGKKYLSDNKLGAFLE
jgi:hypothetical protein